MFYPLHPILNKIIYSLNQQEHFRITFVLVVIYICFNFVKQNIFYASDLILWITIYFVISYMKLYLNQISDDINKNVYLLLIGLLGHLGIIVATNCLGVKISFFQDKILHWNSNCNPFILLMVIAMFNIARNFVFFNRFINYISKLSLLIYIAREHNN